MAPSSPFAIQGFFYFITEGAAIQRSHTDVNVPGLNISPCLDSWLRLIKVQVGIHWELTPRQTPSSAH